MATSENGISTSENGIYVLQGVVPSQIAAAPVAIKVVDLDDDNGNAFTQAQVSQMESGGGTLLGYFSIGEAENYRSYFSSLSKSDLGPVDPSWPGDYQVAYWSADWWTVSTNHIHQMITLGYQGAFLDVVDEAETPWAQAHAPGGDPEGAMMTLVENLGAYAHSLDPNFQIWINSSGAEDMLTNKTFVNSVDGVYEEQLFYQDATTPESPADVKYNVNLLDNVLAAGKPVIAVEYVSGPSEIASVKSQAAADGIGYYIAAPNFNLDGVDTQGFTSGSGSSSTSANVSGIAASSANADLGSGQSENFTVTFSAPVKVSGAAPALLLNDGAEATYVSGSGTSSLVFRYTVGAGQNTTKLALATNPFVNAASITDTSGTPANVSAWAKGSALSGTILVDTARTRVSIAAGTGQPIPKPVTTCWS